MKGVWGNPFPHSISKTVITVIAEDSLGDTP